MPKGDAVRAHGGPGAATPVLVRCAVGTAAVSTAAVSTADLASKGLAPAFGAWVDLNHGLSPGVTGAVRDFVPLGPGLLNGADAAGRVRAGRVAGPPASGGPPPHSRVGKGTAPPASPHEPGEGVNPMADRLRRIAAIAAVSCGAALLVILVTAPRIRGG